MDEAMLFSPDLLVFSVSERYWSMQGSDKIVSVALQSIESGLLTENATLLQVALQTLKFETPFNIWEGVLRQLRRLRNVHLIPRDARDAWFELELGTPDWGNTLGDDLYDHSPVVLPARQTARQLELAVV